MGQRNPVLDGVEIPLQEWAILMVIVCSNIIFFWYGDIWCLCCILV